MNHIAKTRNRTAAPVLVWAVLAFVAASASARLDEVLALDIPAQEAGPALVKLAKSSGVQITLAGDAGADVEVEGLQGQYRLEEALTTLLAGTGLTHEFASADQVLVRPTGEAADKDDASGGEAKEEEEKEQEDEDIVELDEQRVTGSRMKGGDPTTTVISFSAADIAARGLSSTEEIFRDLPWAFNSHTSQSNIDFAGPPDVDSVGLGFFGLGTSSVNLRAMGSRNTLVLINGRRLAGQGGQDSDVVNLMNIPLSAIERVDIELGSASAIYGADAVGGVVNFITKKRHIGLEATARQELSATDANRRTMSVRGGYAWLDGSMTANLSRTESEPINHRKIWTSNDFRDQYGPEYDLRNYRETQPGTVCQALNSYIYAFCQWGAQSYQLRPGHSGVGATVDDFTTDIQPTDYVHHFNGEDSTNLSLNVRAEQHFGDNLMIHGEVLYSDHDAYRELATTLSRYRIPASNAYNPFGYDVVVSYIPLRELNSGLFPARSVRNENQQRAATAGAIWSFGDSHELNVNLTRSNTRLSGVYSKHDYIRDRDDPSATEFYLALESSDPDVALNPFGDGTVQASNFGGYLSPYTTVKSGTVQDSREAILRGNLLEIWGGPITYVLGGEHRERTLKFRQRSFELGTRDVWEAAGYETSQPQLEVAAVFAELGFPLVDERNALPGLRALYVSLQARRDNYTFRGPNGGLVGGDRVYREDRYKRWIPGTGWTEIGGGTWPSVGTVNHVELKKSDTSPRVGLQYKPMDSLAIRVAWAHSFHPPRLGQLLNEEEVFGGESWVTDPLHPSGEPTRTLVLNRIQFANPNLRPEYGDKRSLSLDWEPQAVPGLRWTLDWSEIRFTDKIEHSNAVKFLYPLTYAANPELTVRDENGYAIEYWNYFLNISSKVGSWVETAVQYTFDTDFGQFAPRLTYSKPLEEYYRLVGAADPIDRVSTVHGSDKYALNGQVSWLWRKFAADLFVYYRPGYTNTAVGRCTEVVGRCERRFQDRPPLELGSFTKVDLTLTYQLDNGLRIRGGGRNIFKRESPTIYGSLGYDVARWDARSRVMFLEMHWAR